MRFLPCGAAAAEPPGSRFLSRWRWLAGSCEHSLEVGLVFVAIRRFGGREEDVAVAVGEVDGIKEAALRSQLNPHFILNTLHTLIGLVRREPSLAEQAIERMGDLLRYGLRLHREAIDEVTLREEWDFVRGYLELERLRLGDRLRLHLDAEEAAMECLVPAFGLQPLVENAIRHAIAPRAEGGRLHVRARRVDGTLRLEVADDGPGASSAALARREGLGLRLLEERLDALYGKAAHLRFVPGSPGLEAEVELPLRLSSGVETA